MAARQSSAADIEKWRKIVSEGESSGMSARAYCLQKNINAKTYSAWKKRLRDMGKDLPALPNASVKSRASRRSPTAKSSTPSKLAKVAKISPNSEKKTDPKVDLETFTVAATLPNGVLIEVACPSEAELKLALQTLSSL